jgi:hypothetical protein
MKTKHIVEGAVFSINIGAEQVNCFASCDHGTRARSLHWTGTDICSGCVSALSSVSYLMQTHTAVKK